MKSPLAWLKGVVPDRLRRLLRIIFRNLVLDRAMKEYRALRKGEIPSKELCDRLVYGWGNESWSSKSDLLQPMTELFHKTSGSVLECGAGLSSLLLGTLADSAGREVISLEHGLQWKLHVEQYLRRFRIKSVTVALAPLKSYETFDWYSLETLELPQTLGLLVCDGPPGDTKGGRFGAVPVLSEYLKPGSVLILDDAHRVAERAVLDEWRRLRTFEVEACFERQFAVIKFLG